METYANASFVGKKMHQKLGLDYAWKLETYESQFPQDLPPSPGHKPQPLSYHDFVRGLSPPSSAAIRALFSSAFYSTLTPYGYSQYDRNVREIQNVVIEKDDAIALDWTFQVVKNYNVPGAKAMFTANVGRTKEVFALALVSNTSVTQVSHMLVNIIKKRANFNPSVLYHDTCPHNRDFWTILFGSTKCELYR